MATIDASVNDPSPADDLALRADCVKIAAALLRGSGIIQSADAGDLLSMAEFLYAGLDR